MLPEVMDKPFMKPIPVYQGEHKKTSSSLSKEFVDKQLSSAVSHYKILMDHAPETAFPCTWERSEENTSELQSLMRISYAVFCLQKKKKITTKLITRHTHIQPQ